mmetsp:Transcript_47847/g.147540  ORF Transcript_47847/g.147540 Transcript_47847/m.147540 type:complete len:524 (+) Transcript_47847:1-1572(+)
MKSAGRDERESMEWARARIIGVEALGTEDPLNGAALLRIQLERLLSDGLQTSEGHLRAASKQRREERQVMLQLRGVGRRLRLPAQKLIHRIPAVAELQEVHAQAPDVGGEAAVARSASRLVAGWPSDPEVQQLRGHERQGPAPSPMQVARTNALASEAKVGELQPAAVVGDQKVCGLEVAMAHSERMHVCKAPRHLPAEALHDREGHDFGLRTLYCAGDEAAQVEVSDVVHHHDDTFSRVQGLAGPDEVRVRWQAHEDAYLRVDGKYLPKGLHAALGYDLYGPQAVLRVVRLEHRCEGPGAQKLPQSVVTHAARDPNVLVQPLVLKGSALQRVARHLPEVGLANPLQAASQLAGLGLQLQHTGRGGPAPQAFRPNGRHLHRPGRQAQALAQADDIAGAVLVEGGGQLELPLRVLVGAEEDRQADKPPALVQGSHGHQGCLDRRAYAEDQHRPGPRQTVEVPLGGLEDIVASTHVDCACLPGVVLVPGRIAGALLELSAERVTGAQAEEAHPTERFAVSLGLRE